jgi:dihydrofolate reductase
MPRIAIIAALGAGSRAIGKENKLLWHIPEDMKRFKALTVGHPVIMGRKTWESLPEKFRPLPQRANIVVTRDLAYEARGASIASSLEEAIAKAKKAEGSEEIFIIGGGQLYAEALPLADLLYLTLVEDAKEGDVFFPEYEKEFTKVISDESHESEGLKYRWVDLERA